MIDILDIARKTIELSEKAQDTEDGKCKECNFDYRGYRHWYGCSDPQNEYKKFRLNNCEKLAKAVILMREALENIDVYNCNAYKRKTLAAVDALGSEEK